jgi:sugar phosphate isomerase/epimerase
MRLGICCPIEKSEDFLAAGFDYVELPAVQILQAERSVRAEVSNVFFPGTISFFGPDQAGWLSVGRRTIESAASAGVKLMVLGSGGSRRAPEAGPESEQHFIDVAFALNEIAQGFGIEVAPESLNKSETNVGNDLGQLSALLAERRLGYAADAYHVLQEEGPTPDWEQQLPYRPSHVHFASLARNVPEADDPMIQSFFDRLKALNYIGRVSFEGNLGSLAPGEALIALKPWTL